MNAAEATPLDALLVPLLHRPPAERLEAIARLAQSLQVAEVFAPISNSPGLPSFVGAWANDPEADKMEQAIQQGRFFIDKAELTQWP